MMSTLRAIAVLMSFCVAACQVPEHRPSGEPSARGGYLTVGVGSDPLTWNRLLAVDLETHVISERIHAALVRVNRETQEIEPELARSWSFSEDGKALTFHLRPGVRFSDGEPFTADDVAFTFRALHHPEVGSPLAETAQVKGEPLVPEVVDSETVRFRIPHRTAVVERLFDSLYILPRHRLETALAEGRFVPAYGIGAPVRDIVGLGPFVVEDYQPGQRVVLKRNPHYWKLGEDGSALPFLDGMIFDISPDSNAQVLKFVAGELDIHGALRPEDFIRLQEENRSNLRLLDLGPGVLQERFWFNLNPAGPTVSEEKRTWFADERFRRAVSLAIDRQSIVEAVYHGLASPARGPVSPANRKWINESLSPPVLNRDEARRLLRSSGFRWDQEGRLLTPGGRRARFALTTNADNRRRTQMALLIQEDLAKLGLEMTFAPLDRSALFRRITQSFDYDACLLGLTLTDPDPSAELPLWLSRAPLHFWHPAQPQPATEWEAKIDDLMEQQMLVLDPAERKRLFDEVQAVLAEKSPLIELVVPHALLGWSRRVQNLKPTPFQRLPLWNCEELYLSGPK